eukprot:jgi/Orpsp1_1/1189305/evm.model.d7180000071000.1
MKRNNNKKNDNNNEEDNVKNYLDDDSFEIQFWSNDLFNSSTGLWIIQLKTLLKKQYILQSRSWKTVIFLIIISPLLAMFLLEFVASLYEFLTESNLHPTKFNLNGVDNCYGPDGSDACINFMFTNCIDDNICQRDPSIDEIMTNFIEANNKRMNYNWETNSTKWENWDSDKLKIEIKERHDIIHVPNGKFIYDFVAEHQNYTNYGLIFDIKKDNDLTNYRYQVLYNSTAHYNNTERHSLSMRIVSIARGLDEAIVKDFPVIGYEGYGEVGKIFNYSFFVNTDFMVLFLLFFTYGIAMGAAAMFITTLVNRVKTAVLIGISILIIGFVFNYLFTGNEMTYSLWSKNINPIYRK